MKQLTKEALAEMLNGNERRNEITKEQEQLAKENNLVVLFPYSDDGLEVKGAIDNYIGAFRGVDVVLLRNGEEYADEERTNTYHKAIGNEILPLSDDCVQPVSRRKIALVWIGGTPDAPSKAWNMTTLLPHAEFAVKEDGELWADGIVIDLDEIQ